MVPVEFGEEDGDVVGRGVVTFNLCDWWSILQRNDGGVGAVTQVLWLLLHTHTHTQRQRHIL